MLPNMPIELLHITVAYNDFYGALITLHKDPIASKPSSVHSLGGVGKRIIRKDGRFARLSYV